MEGWCSQYAENYHWLFYRDPHRNINFLSYRDTIHQVTDEQNSYLVHPIEEEEVKVAVFSMHPEKSPGDDGLNTSFYQIYWSIVGSDVVLIFFLQEIYNLE